jgi:hypothetical protein
MLLAAGAMLFARGDDRPFTWDGAEVVLVGDSHLGSPSFRRELIAALEARGARVVGMLQNNGWSESRYLESGLLGDVPGSPTAAVVVLGGNNRRFDAAYGQQLAAIVGALRGQGIDHIVWVGPATSDVRRAPNTAERHEKTANLQAQILPGMGVRWWDSRRSTMTNHRNDGVHFDGDGYTRWARDFAATL